MSNRRTNAWHRAMGAVVAAIAVATATIPSAAASTGAPPAPSAIGDPGPPDCAVSAMIATSFALHELTFVFEGCRNTTPGREPTGYRVEVTGATTFSTTVAAEVPGQEVRVKVPNVPAGQLARVSVTPYNALGDSSLLPAVDGGILPQGNVGTFIFGLVTQLTGDPLRDPGQAADLTRRVTNGQVTIRQLADGRSYLRYHYESVARLYQAYFLRTPDKAGLVHWVDQHRFGAWLHTISSSFAASSEFARRYGTLSNRAFVAQLYRNVFDRAADAEGLDFWAHRLDTKKATRGMVVLQFSESTEAVRKYDPVVAPLADALVMLGRLPTPAERTAWAALADPGTDAVLAILASDEYGKRMAGS